MSITKHQTVLSALEKRALRHRRRGQLQVDMDEVLYKNALDKTGTVSTAGLSDSDAEDRNTTTTEYTERVEINGVSNKLLELHGISPGKKPDGVTGLIYENPNEFNS